LKGLKEAAVGRRRRTSADEKIESPPGRASGDGLVC